MSVSMIMKSKNDYSWKEDRLVGVINTLVDAAAQGNLRNIGVIVTAIKCLNDMAGHNAPTSTINVNVGEDVYIKKLNEVTLALINEKRKIKMNELREVTNDRA